jgi:hypothetical protein
VSDDELQWNAQRDALEQTPTAVPVTCPQCGTQSLSEFPALVIIVGLTRWKNMVLSAPCHAGAWNASLAELDAIRVHLGEPWLDAHRYLMQAGDAGGGSGGLH